MGEGVCHRESTSMSRPWLPILSLFLFALVACGDDSVAPSDASMDAAMDAGARDAGDPDAMLGDECETDPDCDDSLECTRDVCNLGLCFHPVDPAVCDDGVFCNGVERCNPERGCEAGEIQTCNDEDVCTIDRCDEENKQCIHAVRDFDGDGEADFFCTGGTDCDDRDPRRGRTFNEVCGNGVDDDCDERIDEDFCGRPNHDVCDDPLDVSAGGFFELSSVGASADYDFSCTATSPRDLVLSFTLETARDLSVRAEGIGLTYLAMQTECGTAETETECTSGFPASLRVRALEPGTYYVLVGDTGGELGVEVIFTDPTPPPTNQDCSMATDVSAGGTFDGTTIDVSDDVASSCTAGGSPDVHYVFTIDEPRDVLLSASSTEGQTLSLGLRRNCMAADGMEELELHCERGAPASRRFYSLEAGTYYVAVESSAIRESDFVLDVEFAEPSTPPAGDVCDELLVATPGVLIEGTLRDKQDDVDITCGFDYRDALYELTVAERSDLTIIADAGGFASLALLGTCGDESSQLRCVTGSPARTRLRDIDPGTYTIVVESSLASDFDLDVMLTPPTMTVDVPPTNEACDDAYVIPETGGVFRGETRPLLNIFGATCGSGAGSPDATFSLTLSERKRVQLSTEGSSFDTVISLHEGACDGLSEIECNDDNGSGGVWSLVDTELDAGTYLIVVDGWGGSSAGDYELEVIVTDPS